MTPSVSRPTEPESTSRLDPWVLGIVGAFLVLFGVYAAFLYVAMSESLQIEASYIQDDR